LFFSGQDNYKNDVFIADRDGNNVRKIAPRNGWNGVIIFTDDGAFHTQGSEYLTWNPDSTSFVYSAQSFETSSIELYKVNISDGSRHQLTYSLKSKIFNVYPEYAKDGRWLTFVSNRTGSRQVFVMDTLDSALAQSQIAEVDSDCAAIWPRWRPDTTLKINSPGR
jgi:Tol biopolymer transport system component